MGRGWLARGDRREHRRWRAGGRSGDFTAHDGSSRWSRSWGWQRCSSWRWEGSDRRLREACCQRVGSRPGARSSFRSPHGRRPPGPLVHERVLPRPGPRRCRVRGSQPRAGADRHVRLPRGSRRGARGDRRIADGRGRLRPVAGALGPSSPRASSNRVRYSRPGIDEWYTNGPLGLEQGFTVAKPTVGRAAGSQLTVSIAVSGDVHPVLAHGGRSVALERAGHPILRYTGLAASDARGRALPAG